MFLVSLEPDNEGVCSQEGTAAGVSRPLSNAEPQSIESLSQDCIQVDQDIFMQAIVSVL